MFCTDSMPRSENTALEQAKRRFDGIGMNIAFHVNLELVSNGFVTAFFPQFLRRAAIRFEIVGKEYVHILTDILVDELLKGAALYVLRVEESEIATALTDTNHDFLVSESVFFSNGFATDIRFIHFDFAVEHRPIRLHHRSAYAMAEIPSRLVAYSERSLNLAGRHALFRFAEEQGSQKPLRQRQVRVVEDRSGSCAELIVAILAVVESLFGFEFDGGHLTARALHAFGPAQAGKHLPALLVGREQGMYVN